MEVEHEPAGVDDGLADDFAARDGDRNYEDALLSELTPVLHDEGRLFVLDALAVDEAGARGHVGQAAHGAGGQLYAVAQIRDKYVAPALTEAFGEPGVLYEVPVFAVDGDEVLGLEQRVHYFVLFAAGVPRNVYIFKALVHDLGAEMVQLVYYAVHVALVAGYGGRRYDYGIV